MESTMQKIIGGRVSVEENLSRFLQTQGVVVRVSVGGGRNSYYISPKIYGVVKEQLSENSNEFLNQHVRDGRISLLQKEEEKKIRNIEARVKKRLKEIAIGYGDSFVPTASFPEFKEYFDKNREEFFEFREELVRNYDAMKSRFALIARSALREMGAREGERELEAILNRLPSKESFSASFRMDIQVSAFPTTENLDMFDESMRAAIQAGTQKNEEDLLVESVISTINEAVSTLSSVIRCFRDNGKLHPRVNMGVKNGAARIAQKNITGNEKMNGFRIEMLEILGQEPDEAANAAEFILASLYNYSKELGVENRLDLTKCPLTEIEIEELSEMYG